MTKLSKRQQQLTAVDRDRLYGVDEALAVVKSNATAKFDETIEVALNLGVDPRHADQMVRGVVTLPAGSATPSPPIGPALGQRGVNIMEFCKAFNASTQELEKGMPIPTVITVYADRSFSFTTKTPPASFLLKKMAKIKSGSKEPGKVSGGTIRRSQLSEIAEMKMKDLNANDIGAATRIIEGSARAMGLQVVEG